MNKRWILKLENGTQIEACGGDDLSLTAGDVCVFRRDFFDDLGEVVREIPDDNTTAPQISSLASIEDLAKANSNLSAAKSALETTRALVERLCLQMSLVNAHYSLDCKLLTIQFCADGRVDFRELVKELSRTLGTRIELRQIGVRDETGIYGGIGVCGRELCCCRILKEFNSINVRMAKDQDLSLTPATISGVCGRLKCCLKFEHEGYVEMERGMPRKGESCETPAGRGRITDRNLLTRKVMVSFESGIVSTFDRDEIRVIVPERKMLSAKNPDRKNNKKRDKSLKEFPPEDKEK